MSDDKSKINYGRGSRQGTSRAKIPQVPKRREFVAWDDTPPVTKKPKPQKPQDPQETQSPQNSREPREYSPSPSPSQRPPRQPMGQSRSVESAMAEADLLLEQARTPSKQRKRPKQSRFHRTMTAFLVIFGMLFVLMLGMLWFVSSQLKPRASSNDGNMQVILALVKNTIPNASNQHSDVREFEVMPGWSAHRVAQELEAQGFIQNARIFGLFLRWQGTDTKIGEGLYDISPEMNSWQLAHSLEQGGRPRTYNVLIPEGYRAVDVATSLSNDYRGHARPKDFLWHIRNDTSLRPEFVASTVETGLEGYLFPARYEVVHDSEPRDIIAAMVSRFAQELDESSLAKLSAAGLSIHDWVILASVVQSEAGSDAEMPTIAGVFLNRLERGMMLQSDPTVAYGLNKAMTELSASAGDFTAEADHAWNTYTRTGLPFGPISNPGHAALQAVLQPTRQNEEGQDWLYFLHDPEGGFHPNLSLEAHNRDVQTYLR